MSDQAIDNVTVRPLKPAVVKSGEAGPISVWLVEDNHTFRRTVARLLNQVPGLVCSQDFSNSEDALESLENGALPDVVLVDVELPGMDGIQAVRRMKSMSPATRIIMLTVFDDHDKIFKAICSGASGYLLKTAPVETVIDSIREVYSGGAPMTPRVARSVLDMFGKFMVPQHDYGLTAREQKILELMTQGLIKKEIADRLSVSYHTVDTHLRNIYAKLHVNTRSGAVAKALKERLF
ncbi:MAG TPA: response regulator transcription factor [Candidatus Dormibacteraeota bacterium]|nr:response regulator transcription factor [Candidatus Dormibacteraeota bacterium]